MDGWTLLYAVCCHLLIAMTLALICDRRYNDALFGRFALVCIFVACVLIVIELWAAALQIAPARDVSRPTVLLVLGFTLFAARHLLKFWLHCHACSKSSGVSVAALLHQNPPR